MKNSLSKIIHIKVWVFCLFSVLVFSDCTKTEKAWLNTELSFESRVQALVSEMTLKEKVAQMSRNAPEIKRLGVPAYNYQGEALHGIAEMAGGLYEPATSFPQSIGMGSTWNPELMLRVSTSISDEGRAYNNLGKMDLTFWSPNINVLRDPRWGRNDEAYSEDPYLMSKMGVAFVKGIQGDDPKYLKSIASPKHFVANNSEYNRHDGDSKISERWLREYYLPAFKATLTEGGAFSTMCAYNRVNGIPACGNEWLLTKVLRDEWGFPGYVVSDCGAILDIYENHKYTQEDIDATALAVNAGCELNCGDVYEEALLRAVQEGLIEESVIDESVHRILLSRFKMGFFDPKEEVQYTSIGKEVIESDKHQALALRAAQESIILLKNENNVLPFSKNIKSIAVIGPNAKTCELGSYSGKPTRRISVWDGLSERVDANVQLYYERGCNITTPDKIVFDLEDREVVRELDDELELIEWNRMHELYKKEVAETDEVLMKRALELASKVDQVVLVMGTNVFVSTEESDSEDLNWPGNQGKLIRDIYKINPNVVLVTVKGYQIKLNWENEHLPAIVESWYGGQEQGLAVADVLLGNFNPSGRLPVTYYKSEENLPHIGDYDITKGRTYWFHEEEVLYPFGYGLSFSNFEYSNLHISKPSFKSSQEEEIQISVDIKNTDGPEGQEVVQLYLKDIESQVIQPIKRLRRFSKPTLTAGETKKVHFTLKKDDFMYWDETTNDWAIEPGAFEIQIGKSAEEIKLKAIIQVN